MIVVIVREWVNQRQIIVYVLYIERCLDLTVIAAHLCCALLFR